jgi:hypothetical protein
MTEDEKIRNTKKMGLIKVISMMKMKLTYHKQYQDP